MKSFLNLHEDLRKWFSKTDPAGDWKRINSKGEVVGPCAREPGEPKPKCMSREKRESLTKKERAAAVRAKRKHDPDPERKGKPINVSNFGKGKISENMENLNEKNVPTNPELWSRAKSLARSKFDVYPSAYANGWASKWYKSKGGSWKTVSEEIKDEFDIGEYDQEGDMAKSDLRSIIVNAKRLHDMIEDSDNLPEWCQNKITLAEDYISTVANYLTAEMNEDVEQIDEITRKLAGNYLSKVTRQNLQKHGMQPDMYGKLTKNRQQGVTNAFKRLQVDKEGKPVYHLVTKEETVEESRGHKVLSTFFKNREVAQRAFTGQNKPVEKPKEEKKPVKESRKAEIVKDIMKKKKSDKFEPEPELSNTQPKSDRTV